MEFIIACDKDCLHSVQTADQFHAFGETKCITRRAEGISIHGAVGQNGYLKELVLDGITGPGIQNVVVDDSVFLKISLIIS